MNRPGPSRNWSSKWEWIGKGKGWSEAFIQVGDLRTEMYSLEKRLEKAQENNDNLNTKCTKVMKKVNKN